MHGKVVLITGGGKRVGAAICRRLHAAGANLMLHYRTSAGEARLLQAELNHQRAKSVALIQADLLDVLKLPSLVEQTLQTFGQLDGLVNNASSFFQTPVGDITPASWNDLMGTNVQAPLFLSQAAAPALYRALKESAARLRAGDDIAAAMAGGAELVTKAGFILDYFEARHADTLAPIASVKDGPVRILVAAKLGKTRLIDNFGV